MSRSRWVTLRLTPNGTADLSAVIQAIRRQGTEADLYRELFAASDLGQVTETTVAGQAGYLVTGPFGAHGLTFNDGWISSWQVLRPDADLTGLLDSMRPVTLREWRSAISGAGDNVSRAVDAAVAETDSDNEVPNLGGDAVLPRYVLPEPWTIQLVTDMGLWSGEDRAKREALSAAYAVPGGSAELIVTQGFSQPESIAAQPGSVPFAVPEILVQIHRLETEGALIPESPQQEVISVAGFDGYLERTEFYDPTAETGSRIRISISAVQGDLAMTIESLSDDVESVRQFAKGLSLHDGDLSHGVVSTDIRFEQLLQLPGELGEGAGSYSRWFAAYATSAGDEASLSVKSLTFEQLQVELMRSASRGVDFGAVAGGRYLANQFERPESLIVEEDGSVSYGEGTMNRGTTLLRYDQDRQILVSLDLAQDLEATITAMEQLIEVDIETWRELVEPYNSKPLEPR